MSVRERNKLEEELIAYRKSAGMVPLSGMELSFIITFILEDRKRICEPLVDWKNGKRQNAVIVIDEAIQLAGLCGGK